MIMNLLDVSKADEGKLVPRPSSVDLRRLVNEVVAEVGVNAEARDVRLQVSLEAERLHADEDLFRRLLTNLVENAIRYAPRDTPISITTTLHAGGAEVRVADAGHGVPVEMREKVFSPFVQLESGERVAAQGSRGLGLTFCKLAVEAHGGRIWIEDAAPGAVFCVRLPHGS